MLPHIGVYLLIRVFLCLKRRRLPFSVHSPCTRRTTRLRQKQKNNKEKHFFFFHPSSRQQLYDTQAIYSRRPFKTTIFFSDSPSKRVNFAVEQSRRLIKNITDSTTRIYMYVRTPNDHLIKIDSVRRTKDY